MHEHWYKLHLDRLKAIRGRENKIPGPREAKQITAMLEKERLRAHEKRLEVGRSMSIFELQSTVTATAKWCIKNLIAPKKSRNACAFSGKFH